MASSRLSSQNPDLIDVGAVMTAFEEINQVKITVFGRVEERHGRSELCWLISALKDDEDLPDRKYLASVSVDTNGGDHRTLEGAIMWALYKLDWQLVDVGHKKPGSTK